MGVISRDTTMNLPGLLPASRRSDIVKFVMLNRSLALMLISKSVLLILTPFAGLSVSTGGVVSMMNENVAGCNITFPFLSVPLNVNV